MNRTVVRFAKYSLVGFGTFFFDLLLLYILTDFFALNYLLAAAVAFLIAVTINYIFSRRYVFSGTLRGVKEGYVNFMLIVLVGLVVVTGGMYVFVTMFDMSYVIARVLLAGVTGFWNYLMNLFVNFKVAGK